MKNSTGKTEERLRFHTELTEFCKCICPFGLSPSKDRFCGASPVIKMKKIHGNTEVEKQEHPVLACQHRWLACRSAARLRTLACSYSELASAEMSAFARDRNPSMHWKRLHPKLPRNPLCLRPLAACADQRKAAQHQIGDGLERDFQRCTDLIARASAQQQSRSSA